MNGIKGKLWAKLTAIILFMISAAVLVLSIVSVAIMLEFNVFFDGGQSLSDYILDQSVRNKLTDITDAIGYYEPFGEYAQEDGSPEYQNMYIYDDAYGMESEVTGEDKTDVLDTGIGEIVDSNSLINSQDIQYLSNFLNSEYAEGSTNLSVVIENSGGEVIYNNFPIDDYSVRLSREITVKKYGGVNYLENVFLTDAEAQSFMDEYFSDSRVLSVEIIPYGSEYILSVVYVPVYEDTVSVFVSVPETLTVQDDILTRVQKWEQFANSSDLVIVMLVISFIVLAACFVFLMSAAGYTEQHEGVHLNFFDKIPLEIVLLAAGALIAFCVFLFGDIVYYGSDLWISAVVLIAAAAVSAFALIVTLMTIAARCKAGKFFIYTIIFGSLIWLYRFAKSFFKNLRHTWKAAGVFSVVFIYDMLNLVAMANGSSDYAVSMFLLGKIVLGIALLCYTVAYGKIKDGCKKISGGQADTVINNEKMPPELKELASDINQIGSGIHRAVDERMKSERLKTELITNVSHDLKTPLTSIVNYVDILSKQDIEPESAREYVDVLVRQSQRMKKLIDDLVEASKASSGAIAVNLERADMSLMITQAVTEYEERLGKARITPILDLPDGAVPVMIDGRLMWRVFDNIIGNICKYAQPDTRVYVSETLTDKGVVVVFKNISKYALNISSDELMERFVRGDSSRSTEGSGLGLSIAKGLCNLQNVKFNIIIDGDLFKVELSMDRLPPDEQSEVGAQDLSDQEEAQEELPYENDSSEDNPSERDSSEEDTFAEGNGSEAGSDYKSEPSDSEDTLKDGSVQNPASEKNEEASRE